MIDPGCCIRAFMLAVALLVSCGGAPRAKVENATSEVSSLLILLPTQSKPVAERLRAMLAARLAEKGYAVTDDRRSKYQMDLDLIVAVREERGLFQVYVNGQLKVSHRARATVVVKADSVVLATASTEYDADDQPPEEDIDALAAAVASPAVTQFAVGLHERAERERRASAQRKERAEREERARRQRAEEQEEADWDAADVKGCRKPARADACEGVVAFMKKNPGSHHAAEATMVRAEAEPKLAELRAFDQLDLDQCRQGMSTRHCGAVRAYLERFPEGAHAERARSALSEGSAAAAAAADNEAWERAHLDECVRAATEDACTGVALYLANHPLGLHTEEAKTALTQAKKKMAGRKAAQAAADRASQCNARCTRSCANAPAADKAKCTEACRANECR
jgi:hypothetical protein